MQNVDVCCISCLHALQIWDISVCKLKCSIKTHSSRIGCLSWHPESHTLLSSGSQLGDIHNYDCRIGGESTSYLTTRFKGHTMDVCSLQWSPTGQYLASGGNDNIVNIWRGGAWDRPILSFDKHTAAVKVCYIPLNNSYNGCTKCTQCIATCILCTYCCYLFQGVVMVPLEVWLHSLWWRNS